MLGIGFGDLLLGKLASGQLAVVGLSQHSSKEYLRSRQHTATRISCYLDWVASEYGLSGVSSKHEVSKISNILTNESIVNT